MLGFRLLCIQRRFNREDEPVADIIRVVGTTVKLKNSVKEDRGALIFGKKLLDVNYGLWMV